MIFIFDEKELMMSWFVCNVPFWDEVHINGLVQDYSNSIVNALDTAVLY